jgi:hypothetical protein
MFRKALEQHINQLTARLEEDRPANHEKELAKINELLTVATDGRFKRLLENQKKRLVSGKKSASDGADVRTRLDLLRSVFTTLKSHPEYNRTRKRRVKRNN